MSLAFCIFYYRSQLQASIAVCGHCHNMSIFPTTWQCLMSHEQRLRGTKKNDPTSRPSCVWHRVPWPLHPAPRPIWPAFPKKSRNCFINKTAHFQIKLVKSVVFAKGEPFLQNVAKNWFFFQLKNEGNTSGRTGIEEKQSHSVSLSFLCSVLSCHGTRRDGTELFSRPTELFD